MTEEIIKRKSDEVAPENDTKLRNRTKQNKKIYLKNTKTTTHTHFDEPASYLHTLETYWPVYDLKAPTQTHDYCAYYQKLFFSLFLYVLKS